MSPTKPAPDIQSQWLRFERWATRFRKATSSLVNELSRQELVDTSDYLCLLKWDEYEGVIVPPHELNELDVLRERAEEKIAFLRGYLVDISFDGSQFMAMHSGFLSLQYQSRCDLAMGFWFEQWPTNSRPGGYFGFQGWDVVLFAASPQDIDFESVNNILPFDRLFIRQAKGVPWTEARAREITRRIKDDLGVSPRKFAKIHGVGSSMISITFNKNML